MPLLPGAELAEILRMAFHLRFPENPVKGTLGILKGTPDMGATRRSGKWRRGRRRYSTQMKGGRDNADCDSTCDIRTVCHGYSIPTRRDGVIGRRNVSSKSREWWSTQGSIALQSGHGIYHPHTGLEDGKGGVFFSPVNCFIALSESATAANAYSRMETSSPQLPGARAYHRDALAATLH